MCLISAYMYRLYPCQAGYKGLISSLAGIQLIPCLSHSDKSCKVCRRHPEIKASKLQLGTAKIAATIVARSDKMARQRL